MFARGESKWLKTAACFVLAVFAMFYCGNTFFVHTHFENGISLTHSHPCLPGANHSHTPVQAQAISLANATVQTIMEAQTVSIPSAMVTDSYISYAFELSFCCASARTEHSLRAPPFVTVYIAA